MTRGERVREDVRKVIFLDIDGVLNSVRNLCHGIDPQNMIHLNELVERTGAIVVVSSTWRNAGLPCMRDTLRVNGFLGRVAGITPFLEPHTDRGNEIQAWLDVARPFAKSFVILDDDEDMGALLPFLVRTDNQVGLMAEDVEKAVRLLTESQP